MTTRITVNNSQNQADDTDCQALEQALTRRINISGFTDVNSKEAICALCQVGGTNNAAGNLAVTLEDSTSPPAFAATTITLKQVKDVLKASNLKFTLRQYARNRTQDCHDIGLKHQIPGDLYKKLIHMFGPISEQDSYWCSSFQMDSDVCPPNVKDMLVKHYNSMFKK